MIMMSDTELEIGSVLVNTDDYTIWVVIEFNKCEDSYYSEAVVVSILAMEKALDYMRIRQPIRYYPYDKFDNKQYISGNDWDEYEKIEDNKKYLGVFKPMKALYMILPKGE